MAFALGCDAVSVGREARLSIGCIHSHPALVTLGHLSYLDARFGVRSAAEVFDYRPGRGVPSDADVAAVGAVMAGERPGRPGTGS